jgi:hypothetical protein
LEEIVANGDSGSAAEALADVLAESGDFDRLQNLALRGLATAAQRLLTAEPDTENLRLIQHHGLHPNGTIATQ